MRSCVTGMLLLLSLLGSGAGYANAEETERAMRELMAQVTTATGETGRRDRLVLQLAQVRESAISESELEWLATYRASRPQDLFAKLYEGYGWLLVAGRYMRQQNYFRAAELAKRGFFLVDEAVDQQPDDWRLRLTRARIDVAVPVEFGRYVVALEDTDVLTGQVGVPSELRGLLAYLRFRALGAAGKSAEADKLAAEFAGSPDWAVAARDQHQMFKSRAEIDLVLRKALESGDE